MLIELVREDSGGTYSMLSDAPDLGMTAATIVARATYRAYAAVSRAIARGELVPGRCATCGTAQSIIGHHPDYSRPLDVVWMCRSCHRKLHNSVVPRRKRRQKTQAPHGRQNDE